MESKPLKLDSIKLISMYTFSLHMSSYKIPYSLIILHTDTVLTRVHTNTIHSILERLYIQRTLPKCMVDFYTIQARCTRTVHEKWVQRSACSTSDVTDRYVISSTLSVVAALLLGLTFGVGAEISCVCSE